MCILNRQLDPKTRRRIVIANLAFILSILLWNSERWGWIHLSSQIEQNYLDAISGFLFGLYIAIMFFGLRGARRCCAIDPEKL
jgi:hypothetical protein